MNIEIFLDTNVFESAKFSYSSQNMVNFLKYCEDNLIRLKVTDVVKYEVKKRIKARITESFEDITKHNIGVITSSMDIDTSLSKLSLIEHLTQKLINDFEDFIIDNDVDTINSNCDILDVVNQYFTQKAPFTEQKKHEFPDAIILFTIQKYISDNEDRIIITISNDESFNEFSEQNDIRNFNFISNALSYLIQNPNMALKNAFKQQESQIKEQLIEKVQQDDFTLYSYDSIHDIAVENTTIESVEIEDLNIIKFIQEEKTIYIESNITISFSCVALYPDPEVTYYDKEEGAYYSFGFCSSDIQFFEKTTCNIKITFDDDFLFDITDLDISNKEFEFYLDERYIVHTEYHTES